MYAIIQTGGKQYRVEKGDVIYVEKLNVEDGQAVDFDVLMLAKDDATALIGAPTVDGAKVVGKAVAQVKGKKIMIMKYKSKKNQRKRQGHRQPYTKVEITEIKG